MKKQKENSREGITWSEMGKQNVQAEKVYCFRSLKCAGFHDQPPSTNYASAKIFNELIHVFYLFAILGYDICYPTDPCGVNNNCRKDLLLGDLWCICTVGVDKYGNCVGKFILIRAVFK